MAEQIIKGWVSLEKDEEVFLLKSENPKETPYYEISDRSLLNLIKNTFAKMGFDDCSEEFEYEKGVMSRYIEKNVSIQLYASETSETLEEIKEKIILDSFGLLKYEDEWYGYSEFTIEGYCIDTFILGGHNILDIIKNQSGKHIYIVINKKERY